MSEIDAIEAAVRKMAHSLPPSDLGSTRAIKAIAVHVRAAVEAEREKHAALCDAEAQRWRQQAKEFRSIMFGTCAESFEHIATAIRARGEG